MILQLNPPLPVYVVDRGNGLAHIVIDYGPESSLIWVVIMDGAGQIWCEPNERVRGQWNHTLGRTDRDETQ